MKKEQLNQALGLAAQHQIFKFCNIVKHVYMEMFALMYLLSAERSLGETKISENVWNCWNCCELPVDLLQGWPRPNIIAMIPLHPHRNPRAYVFINDKKDTKKQSLNSEI